MNLFIKTILLSIMLIVGYSVQSALYIVSGSNFRTSSLTFEVDIQDTNVPIGLLYFTSPGIDVSIDGEESTWVALQQGQTSQVWSPSFSTAGKHIVKVYTKTNNQTLMFRGNPQLITKMSQSGVLPKFVSCQSCSNLNSVIIRNGVKTIPNGAFQDSDGFTNVYIPDSVIDIGSNAFNQNNVKTPVLSNIRLPQNSELTTIQFNTFFRTKGLTQIVFPKTIINFGKWVMYDIPNLKTITIGKTSDCDDEAFVKLPYVSTINYYGTLEEWKQDKLSTFFGTTSQNSQPGVNTIQISGGSTGTNSITLNFNYSD